MGKKSSYEENWISKNNLEEKDVWIQYLYSFYYICITMSTVGYGDISPQNPNEMVFITIFTYFSSGMFAYVINSIGNIVSDISKRQNDFSKEMNVINSFMKEKNISFDLQIKIRKYLEYIFHEDKLEKLQEQSQIINKLSENLKEELFVEANGSIIRDIKVLSLNFSEDTLRKTVSIMKEVKYTPGDLIFESNLASNDDLFIVRKGKIEIFLNNKNDPNDVTIIKSINEGGVFGEKTFFSNKERQFSARSLDFSTIDIIKKKDFLAILKWNQKDYEKFCEIKDRINIYNDISHLYMKCPSCKQNTHDIDQCPTIHYQPLNNIIIQKYLFNPPQSRQIFKRNKKQKEKLLFIGEVISNEKDSPKIQKGNFSKTTTEKEELLKNSYNYSKKNLSGEISASKIKLFGGSLQDIEFEDPDLEESKKIESKEIISVHELYDSTIIESLEKMPKKQKNDKNYESQNSLKEKYFLNKQKTEKHLSKIKSFNFTLDKSEIIQTLNERSYLSDLDKSMSKLNQLQINESISELDGIKSFEQYFNEGNIEMILKKLKSSLTKYIYQKIQEMKSNGEEINVSYNQMIQEFLKESKKSLSTKDFRSQKKKTVKDNYIGRQFFKNPRNLEKLHNDERFSPQKIKNYYKKIYNNSENNGLMIKIKKFLNNISKKTPKTRNDVI